MGGVPLRHVHYADGSPPGSAPVWRRHFIERRPSVAASFFLADFSERHRANTLSDGVTPLRSIELARAAGRAALALTTAVLAVLAVPFLRTLQLAPGSEGEESGKSAPTPSVAGLPRELTATLVLLVVLHWVAVVWFRYMRTQAESVCVVLGVGVQVSRWCSVASRPPLSTDFVPIPRMHGFFIYEALCRMRVRFFLALAVFPDAERHALEDLTLDQDVDDEHSTPVRLVFKNLMPGLQHLKLVWNDLDTFMQRPESKAQLPTRPTRVDYSTNHGSDAKFQAI